MRTFRLVTLLLMAVLALGTPVARAAQEDGTTGATPEASPQASGGFQGAVDWLLAQQGENGGFLGFSGEADAGTTIDAVFGLVSAELSGIDTGDSIDRAVAYLESEDIALVYTQTGPGQAAKLALLLTTLGLDPHDFANVDPLAILDFGQNEETGIYGTGIYDHAYAILALTAAGEEIPDTAITALADTQAENGGWAFDGTADDAAADSNTTALVIQALAASGLPDEGMIEAGLAYLESTLRDGEGAAYNSDEASLADANSTALVAQAVIATGGDPASEEWGDLIAALLGFQNADGSFYYQTGVEDPNLLATAQALPVMAGLAYPIAAMDGSFSTPVGQLPVESWHLAA